MEEGWFEGVEPLPMEAHPASANESRRPEEGGELVLRMAEDRIEMTRRFTREEVGALGRPGCESREMECSGRVSREDLVAEESSLLGPVLIGRIFAPGKVPLGEPLAEFLAPGK